MVNAIDYWWKRAIAAEAELKKVNKRVETATKYLHNIRTYSLVYTPIKDGCTQTLRVLKGRADET